MPTSPTEWRTVLVRYITEAESGETLFDAEVSTYLTALLREWDKHDPGFTGRFCPTCNYSVYIGDGLCPARRRMMGE